MTLHPDEQAQARELVDAWWDGAVLNESNYHELVSRVSALLARTREQERAKFADKLAALVAEGQGTHDTWLKPMLAEMECEAAAAPSLHKEAVRPEGCICSEAYGVGSEQCGKHGPSLHKEELDFGTAEEVIAGLDAINKHNAALHKETRCNIGHPLRSDWKCDLPATHGDEPHHYPEMDVPVALHKEVAGGAPSCKYCDNPKWQSAYFMPEVPPNGMWWHKNLAGDIAMPCERATIAPLPLQRTLPDEQFKGAVVEPITSELSDADICRPMAEIKSTIRREALEEAARIVDNWRWVANPPNVHHMSAAIRSLASPAGRAEQDRDGS